MLLEVLITVHAEDVREGRLASLDRVQQIAPGRIRVLTKQRHRSNGLRNVGAQILAQRRQFKTLAAAFLEQADGSETAQHAKQRRLMCVCAGREFVDCEWTIFEQVRNS